MKYTVFFISFFMLIFSSCVSIAYAKRFHKDGHEIEILWKQKGKKLKAWGKITGGESTCVQMNLSIYFKNSVSGRSAHIDTTINNYRPSGRSNYSGQDKLYLPKNNSFHSKSTKNKWYVDDYYLKCLN